MKRKILPVLLAALVFATGALAQTTRKTTAQAGAGVEQALMDIEHKWADAAKTNDTNLLDSILADSFVTTEADGRTRTKFEVVERAKKSRLDRSEVSEMQVRVFGDDTAVVTGIWSGSGTDAEGNKFDTTERFTDTFVKQGSQWKAVASQSLTLKK